MEEFNKLPKNYDMPYSKIESLDKNTIVRTLVNNNFYLVNNNGSRNHCLMYGKNNYEWTFVLDSNIHFTYVDSSIVEHQFFG